MENKKKKLIKIYTSQEERGFLGQGHTARPLVMGNFTDTDPFIALMDDMYSGSLDGLSSPIQNYVPLIVAEIIIKPGLSTTLRIPADFNTFLVAISG